MIFTAALASLVYGLIESNQRSFTDRLVLGCLAAAAVLFAVFVIVERRSAHPMFDLTLLRLPTFSGGSVAAAADAVRDPLPGASPRHSRRRQRPLVRSPP